MNTYTYSETRQKFATILDKAKKDGKVLVKRKDGSIFEIKSLVQNKSPLNVKGIKINLNKEEIIDILKEVRER